MEKTKIHRIPTQTLDDILPPTIEVVPRKSVLSLWPRSNFDRAKSTLSQMKESGVAPKTYRHQTRSKVYDRQTLETIYQFMQLTQILGTVKNAILQINDQMEALINEQQSREEARSYQSTQEPTEPTKSAKPAEESDDHRICVRRAYYSSSSNK